MKITNGPLSGLLIIKPDVFTDERGYFYEVFQQARYAQYHIPPFVQDNVSRSKKNVLRGLHYQLPHAQGKLIYVTYGTVWDVAVDIRIHSPTFGQWVGIELSDKNHIQVFIPPGFAHGFCVLSEEADFHYKCTDYYYPDKEHGIAWNDARLNIAWPVQQPILSEKDKTYPFIQDVSHDVLFTE